MRKVGAHVSASGGLHKAVERAKDIGANCVQLFSGSPRVWKRKSLAEIDTKKMFSKQKELSISPVFTHALYLVNLASDKPELLRKSFDTLQYELEFDSHIEGAGIIVHLGSHQGRGWDAVKEQVAKVYRSQAIRLGAPLEILQIMRKYMAPQYSTVQVATCRA